MFGKRNNFEKAKEDLGTILSRLYNEDSAAINELLNILFIDPLLVGDKFAVVKACDAVRIELKNKGYVAEVRDEELINQVKQLLSDD
jgi:hypothetical protein